MEAAREENGSNLEKANNAVKRERSRSGHRSRSRSRSPRERDWKRSERSERKDSDRKDGDRKDSERNRGSRSERNRIIKLHISNIPYDLRWQQVKDLFREKANVEVVHVVLYDGLDGRPQGAGFIDVRGEDMADRCIEKMHRYEIDGRKIIVREAREKDIQRFEGMPMSGRPRAGRHDDGPQRGEYDGPRAGGYDGPRGGFDGPRGGYNDGPRDGPRGGYNDDPRGGYERDRGYDRDRGGLRDEPIMSLMDGPGLGIGGGSSMPINYPLLQRLGIEPESLTNQVFVANLHYRVNERKLEEIFSMAGKIINSEIKKDRDGRSRGFGTVTFEHPMEAAQAVSMFNGQSLYERDMSVKIDKRAEPPAPKLPSGLKSIGMGLGLGGMPIQNFSQSGGMVGGAADLALFSGGGVGGFAGGLGLGTGLSAPLGGAGLVGASGLGAGLNAGLGGPLVGSALGGSLVQNSLAGNLGQSLAASAFTGNSLLGNATSSGLMGLGGSGLGLGLSSQLTGSGAGLAGSASVGLGSLGSNLSDVGSQPYRGIDINRGYGAGGKDGLGVNNMGGTRDDSRGFLAGRDDMRMGNATNLDNDTCTIVVRNLPFNMTWQELRDKFIDCGDIKVAEMIQNGVGVVQFLYADDARRAVSLMHGARLAGRQISVQLEAFN